MKNKRNRALGLTEIVLALPVLFLLWVLAVEFTEKYGLIVLPLGGAVYLVISILVDKLFSKQSEQLELALERKLPFAGTKPGTVQGDS